MGTNRHEAADQPRYITQKNPEHGSVAFPGWRKGKSQDFMLGIKLVSHAL